MWRESLAGRFGLTFVSCSLLLTALDERSSTAQGQTTKPPAAASATTYNPQALERTTVKIAPVNPKGRGEALDSAARIDELVQAKLKYSDTRPNGPCTDEQFVRRIYLDATGTIPTSKQVDTFLKFTGKDKRVALIDTLLNSPGYGSQMFNWLADILRLMDVSSVYTYTRPYSDWIKECMRDNKPWDAMVREMLTADGRVIEHPAAGYFMRDRDMPLDNLNNTVRIFLGTRIGCAQCHDHPFDRWKQKEFYQLAAFVGGMQYNMPKDKQIPVVEKDTDALAPSIDSPDARIARNMLRASRRMTWENPNKKLKFPMTYGDEKLRDKVVTPAVLWGTAPSTVPFPERRKIFADWVTSPENPRFALTIANRLWKKAMGVGLIEPVDDMKDDSTPSNPELMKFLSEELIRLKFDLKEFQRIIYNTKTYQSKVTYDELDTNKPYYFQGPVLRRMTAEQVWDSLLTLTIESPDTLLRPADDAYVAAFFVEQTMTAKQVIDSAKEVQTIQKDEAAAKKKRLYKGNDLLRASEQPQPVPEGHFLRQFGQSDRTAISDSHTDGTVPQLMTLFNGPVTHMMLEGGSVIFNDVTSAKSTSEQIERIFLCLLGRRPTPGEKTVATKEINTTGPAGIGNVIWALLNTREFLFIQ